MAAWTMIWTTNRISSSLAPVVAASVVLPGRGLTSALVLLLLPSAPCSWSQGSSVLRGGRPQAAALQPARLHPGFEATSDVAGPGERRRVSTHGGEASGSGLLLVRSTHGEGQAWRKPASVCRLEVSSPTGSKRHHLRLRGQAAAAARRAPSLGSKRRWQGARAGAPRRTP
jgi:hypothetical protein